MTRKTWIILIVVLIILVSAKINLGESTEKFETNRSEISAGENSEVNLSKLVLIGQCVGLDVATNANCKNKDLDKDGNVTVLDMNLFVNSPNLITDFDK